MHYTIHRQSTWIVASYKCIFISWSKNNNAYYGKLDNGLIDEHVKTNCILTEVELQVSYGLGFYITYRSRTGLCLQHCFGSQHWMQKMDVQSTSPPKHYKRAEINRGKQWFRSEFDCVSSQWEHLQGKQQFRPVLQRLHLSSLWNICMS